MARLLSQILDAAGSSAQEPQGHLTVIHWPQARPLIRSGACTRSTRTRRCISCWRRTASEPWCALHLATECSFSNLRIICSSWLAVIGLRVSNFAFALLTAGSLLTLSFSIGLGMVSALQAGVAAQDAANLPTAQPDCH